MHAQATTDIDCCCGEQNQKGGTMNPYRFDTEELLFLIGALAGSTGLCEAEVSWADVESFSRKVKWWGLANAGEQMHLTATPLMSCLLK
jgi:hypothetical protein